MMRQLSQGQPPRSAGFCWSLLVALSKHSASLLTFSDIHGQPFHRLHSLSGSQPPRWVALLPPAAAQTNIMNENAPIGDVIRLSNS